MTFGDAHRQLMGGVAVTRRAWPAGFWLALITPHPTHPLTQPFLALDKPPRQGGSPLGDRVPYLPSVDDLAASDWLVVE